MFSKGSRVFTGLRLGALELQVVLVAVRVRLRIQRGDKSVETPALANSGYEAETLQILISERLAKLLGLWSPLPNS